MYSVIYMGRTLTECLTVSQTTSISVLKTSFPLEKFTGFQNNKPCITSQLKEHLKKKRAFRTRDKDDMRQVQRELKVKIRECKDSYKNKLEINLQQNNNRDE